MNKITKYKARLLKSATREVQISRVKNDICSFASDVIAIEEPLEIKLGFGQKNKRDQRSISVTMRTPGNDKELAIGFLFTEGIVASEKDILSIQFIATQLDSRTQDNVILVNLKPDAKVEVDKLSRHFYTSSSCGVCGKASIDLIQTISLFYPKSGFPLIQYQQLFKLPQKLKSAQSVFTQTGSIHAAALFEQNGKLVLIREDVGRHNALDKLIGAAIQQRKLPFRDLILILSGRISFELVQKAAMCGIPIVAAVGAPSSLAIELAEAHGMTLIGFLKDEKFNIYCGEERIGFQNR